MIQGAIFDQDGLMFDTERSWFNSWPGALAEFGLTYPDGLAEATRGTNGAEFNDAVRRVFGTSVKPEDVRRALSRHATADIRAHIEKKPGLDELLDFLADEGVPCAVATSSAPDLTEFNLKRTGLSGRFAAVVTSEQVTHFKPDPEIFLVAARRLGTEPARTLVLEDSKQGLRAARAGGFITVMVPDLSGPDAETDALVDACCSSLLEVRDLLAAGKLG